MDSTTLELVAVAPFLLLLLGAVVAFRLTEGTKGSNPTRPLDEMRVVRPNRTVRFSPRTETAPERAARLDRIARASDSMDANAFIESISIASRHGSDTKQVPKRVTCEYCGRINSTDDDECCGCGAPVEVAA